MELADKTLTCRECGTAFVFSVGEQEFFRAKGLTHEPGRCPACRAAAKRLAQGGAAAPERPAREMHTAVCAECGSQALVPFLPRNDRPVYCSSCFDKVRAGTVAVS
ncbi:MAG: zinc-ribbon domain containing protein [Chloroflexota bacterium]